MNMEAELDNNRSTFSSIIIFCLGTVLGGFVATVVIREAVPLRDHYVAIIISFVSSGILICGLIAWYFKVIKACKVAFGQKGGSIINTIMSFLLVSVCLLYIIVVSIFYMAIA